MDAGEFDLIIKTVREFIAREVIPREDEIEETDSVPQVLRDGARELGLFGYALPEEYGGLGFTMSEEVRLAFELGRTAPAFRSMFGTNNGIAGQTINNYGTEAQKEKWLPALSGGAVASEVYFDDMRVPSDALIGGEEDVGFRAAMQSLAKGRLTIGALCVGMAERNIEEATFHAANSRQGGRPIGDFQLVQALLAESHTEARAGRALALSAAEAFDAGTDTREGPATTKLFCSEMVGRVADRGVQVLGGLGYMRTVPIERFYRDARLYRIYEGTSEIQKLIIARQMLSRAKAA
jgi:alkylation response protein AidB-like acyl-CoA dehydrogenase